MGDIAQLPVNELRLDFNKFQTLVSMGDIAQLPVNGGNNLEVLPVESFNGRHCPTPCQRKPDSPIECDLVFQWATLPNSLSTLYFMMQPLLRCFNGRHCPTPCQPTAFPR